MSRIVLLAGLVLLIAISPIVSVSGQEFAGPIRWNPFQVTNTVYPAPAKKTTAVQTLPFFEDFTDYGACPDSSKWQDCHVYVNNTMSFGAISRGVATFDDLNVKGLPYDSFNNGAVRYADSLTSQPIDLSADTVTDSVYLSFFYQPQGNGFYPLLQDSLMLFFKNRYGDFVKVWSIPGSTLRPFQQVMIPITDTLYFHGTFQFMFINIAALYWADAVWNVDYIRMDRNRSMADTAVPDVAFITTPSFLLSDYTSMPYSQFIAGHAWELASQVSDSIRNNDSVTQTVNYSYTVRDEGTGATLSSSGPTSLSLSPNQEKFVTAPLSISAFPVYPLHKSVVFETKYFMQTTAPGSLINDTVVRSQTFDNYLSYDDGTAEKSYYLNQLPSLPGKIAIEYHLNHTDTLRGMAIYFGRQIPFAFGKVFAIYIYSALAGINGSPKDIIIDSTDLLSPAYADSVNHFWYYTFAKPRLLPPGTFYAGTLQPVGGSDSLYFGLDVNRIGGNHAYFNVFGNWTPSSISGAIMMRPLLGRYISGSSVDDVQFTKDDWQIFPNPAQNEIRLRYEGDNHPTFRITDLQGKVLLTGKAQNDQPIDISQLSPGMYFMNLMGNGVSATPQKIIKL